MKVALDTNLVVRLVIDDDIAQADQAERLLDQADEVMISIITFCEVVWVLRRSYRMPPAAISMALRQIGSTANVTLDRSTFEAGVTMLENGGDFADGCILFEAERAKCDRLATFDTALIARSRGRAGLP